MSFASDNWAGAAPQILEALARANDGAAPSYGGDALTKKVEASFSKLFEFRNPPHFEVAPRTVSPCR